MCGARITFASERSLLSVGIGSGSQTSRAAAPTCPDSSAATSAAVSIRSPRARLTTIAPRLILARVGVQELAGLRGRGAVERDDIGLSQQIAQRRGLATGRANRVGRNHGVADQPAALE